MEHSLYNAITLVTELSDYYMGTVEHEPELSTLYS